jgi:hypothetical protein
MRASDVFLLRDWIKNNRTRLISERPKLSDIRGEAELALQLKCSIGAISDCMDAEKMPRRMGKDAAKIHGLTEERDKYRSILVKMLALNGVNPIIANELRELLAFDKEVSDLIKHRESA